LLDSHSLSIRISVSSVEIFPGTVPKFFRPDTVKFHHRRRKILLAGGFRARAGAPTHPANLCAEPHHRRATSPGAAVGRRAASRRLPRAAPSSERRRGAGNGEPEGVSRRSRNRCISGPVLRRAGAPARNDASGASGLRARVARATEGRAVEEPTGGHAACSQVCRASPHCSATPKILLEPRISKTTTARRVCPPQLLGPERRARNPGLARSRVLSRLRSTSVTRNAGTTGVACEPLQRISTRCS